MMMSPRDEVEAQYKVENGVIRSPGKFEGEPVWAPDFWALVLEGSADDHERGVYIFEIDSSDVERWPELREAKKIEIWEDDLGFVNTRITKVFPAVK